MKRSPPPHCWLRLVFSLINSVTLVTRPPCLKDHKGAAVWCDRERVCNVLMLRTNPVLACVRLTR